MPDLKLSDGTAADALTGAELLEVSQDIGGTLETRVATAAEIAALATGVGAGAPVDTISASLTLGATHAGKFLLCSHASVAIAVTAPQDSDWAAPVGTEVHLYWEGVAAVSVVAGTGATVHRPASRALALEERYAAVTLKKKAADTWALFGQLAAA